MKGAGVRCVELGTAGYYLCMLMKDKVRAIRISDKVWSELKRRKPQGKSWNLFLKELCERRTEKNIEKD